MKGGRGKKAEREGREEERGELSSYGKKEEGGRGKITMKRGRRKKN